MGATTGIANPNWRGGRTVTSHGYVLIRRPEHPDADCRGYIYEHRFVAEQKLGRRLKPGEQVHHVNEIKTDNRPENIEVFKSRHHHAVEHRTAPNRQRLRLPGQDNPTVSCACGCGQQFRRFDKAGRPRSFVSGHNVARNTSGQWAPKRVQEFPSTQREAACRSES